MTMPKSAIYFYMLKHERIARSPCRQTEYGGRGPADVKRPWLMMVGSSSAAMEQQSSSNDTLSQRLLTFLNSISYRG